MAEFEGKKVLIAGLGKSGKAAKELLDSLGAEVSVWDEKLGCFPAREEKFDVVVLSPGVPPGKEYIKSCSDAGALIIGELELSYLLCRGQFLAITGTNGKTTTTTLLGEIFKNAGKDVFVVGNIGLPGCAVAQETGEESWLVTEVSSFQLETIKDFRPRISVLLNITPDHLDRHITMENYIDAKAKIFMNQNENDHFVVNYDDKESYGLAGRCRAKIVPFSRTTELDFGVFVKDGEIVCLDEKKCLTRFIKTENLLIPGDHNLENALAAVAASYFADIQSRVISETLSTFPGVEHRLEDCGELGGVRFINDSKGTNPDASIKAVEALAGPIILIAGGYDKKSGFESFIDSFGGKVKYMVLLGETAGKIKETADNKGFFDSKIVSGMEECLSTAYGLAAPGDTVLLSPACASWDMYTDFEERGRHFKECIGRLRADGKS